MEIAVAIKNGPPYATIIRGLQHVELELRAIQQEAETDSVKTRTRGLLVIIGRWLDMAGRPKPKRKR